MRTEDLLPRHQHFLENYSRAFGAGSTSMYQYWIVLMESAIPAAKMVSSGCILPGQMEQFNKL